MGIFEAGRTEKRGEVQRVERVGGRGMGMGREG